MRYGCFELTERSTLCVMLTSNYHHNFLPALGGWGWELPYMMSARFSDFLTTPPLVTHKSAGFVPFVSFLGTLSPSPTADVIYESPLTRQSRRASTPSRVRAASPSGRPAPTRSPWPPTSSTAEPDPSASAWGGIQ